MAFDIKPPIIISDDHTAVLTEAQSRIKLDRAAINRAIAKEEISIRNGAAYDVRMLSPGNVPPLPEHVATAKILVMDGVITVSVGPSKDMRDWIGRVHDIKAGAGIHED